MKKNANAENFDCNNCPVDKNGLCDEHYSCVRSIWNAALESLNAAASTNKLKAEIAALIPKVEACGGYARNGEAIRAIVVKLRQLSAV